MSKEEKKTPAATSATSAAPPVIKRPEGLINLMAKYPQYDPGADARTDDVGTKGYPVHGRMLGIIDLPKTLKDPKTGEMKDWTGLVIELIQPALAVDPETDESRYYGPGERIMVTVSKVLERPEIRRAADHPYAVYECYFQPEVAKTKDKQSLWIFPIFDVGRPIKREAKHQVANVALALAEQFAPATNMFNPAAPVAGALPAGNAAPHAHAPQGTPAHANG